MSAFLNNLNVILLQDNASGGKWQLSSTLLYASDIVDGLITVPSGFITDFASVPRLPVVYLLNGDTAHAAAVVHDYLYAAAYIPRNLADKILYEAMRVTGVPLWRAGAMYAAVRLFGGQFYGRKKKPLNGEPEGL